ncbi:hypothetical protein TSUD_153510 [Trifolium subterraneum]|uniref:Uncharacterized protein n=1 Tax=Trifolium subterraneum TaxID=3900 RepID=A0A2Z6MK81_TRISU|nr:hypothetical protein TSUD_153510 [Trifolium subterraneum]
MTSSIKHSTSIEYTNRCLLLFGARGGDGVVVGDDKGDESGIREISVRGVDGEIGVQRRVVDDEIGVQSLVDNEIGVRGESMKRQRDSESFD